MMMHRLYTYMCVNTIQKLKHCCVHIVYIVCRCISVLMRRRLLAAEQYATELLVGKEKTYHPTHILRVLLLLVYMQPVLWINQMTSAAHA